MVNFASLRANSAQTPNPGGVRKLAKMISDNFTSAWPIAADIVAGEITTLPSTKLPEDEEWPLYTLPKETCLVEANNIGDMGGYQNWSHKIDFELAGISKTIQAEISKDINAGAVYLAQMNDGQWVAIGTSDNPIFVGHSQKTGGKGSDKRGSTVSGEQEGYGWGLVPLADTVVADIAFLAIV